MLRVGVIGCGAIGREHIKRLSGKLQGSMVTAVYDKFENSAKEAASLVTGNEVKIYTDVQAIVNDPNVDALVVTSPGFAHKEAVLPAVRAGKPVFCEKPLCTTAVDCKEIVDAEIEAGRHLVQVGFMRRYDKGYNQVKTLIDSGDFGNPLVVKCTHRAIEVDSSYSTQMAVTDTAIHEIDCLHWLLDDDWDNVQVITGANTKFAHSNLRDPQVMIMQSKKGITVLLEVFVNCKFGYDINCEVVCEDGVIHMPAPSFPAIRKAGKLSTDIETNWINRFIDSYDVELQDWLDHAARFEVEGPNAWDGYMAAVTADALVAAQSSGKIEKVALGETPEFYKK